MSEKALQVLLVEDNAGDARLVREMFRSEKPGSVKLTHLSLMSEAVIHLEQGGKRKPKGSSHHTRDNRDRLTNRLAFQ